MNQRGFVLPLVLLTLAILGALAGAVMLLSRLRWQSGTRTLETLQARTAAESGVDRALASWDPLLADSMPIGATVALPAVASGRGVSVVDSLMRLGNGLFQLHSVGLRVAADGTPLAREGIATLVRLTAPTLPDSMAVAAAGPVDVTGAGQVDGDDQVPPGWTGLCPAPGPPGAGVMAAAGASVRALCSGGPCVAGAPAIGLDSALTAASLSQLGPVSLTELYWAADHRVNGTVSAIRPVVRGGACDLGDSLNWGDPASGSSPCGRFFPVVAAAPATRILGGQGQGLLVAMGALELAGDATFTGVVLATGPVVLRDQAKVIGVVLAQDSLLVMGSAAITRSRCAVGRAGRGAARPENHVGRAWFRWD